MAKKNKQARRRKRKARKSNQQVAYQRDQIRIRNPNGHEAYFNARSGEFYCEQCGPIKREDVLAMLNVDPAKYQIKSAQ